MRFLFNILTVKTAANEKQDNVSKYKSQSTGMWFSDQSEPVRTILLIIWQQSKITQKCLLK